MRRVLNTVIVLGWLAGVVLAAHAITSSGTLGFVFGVGFLVGSLATIVRLNTLSHRCSEYERLLREHNINAP